MDLEGSQTRRFWLSVVIARVKSSLARHRVKVAARIPIVPAGSSALRMHHFSQLQGCISIKCGAEQHLSNVISSNLSYLRTSTLRFYMGVGCMHACRSKDTNQFQAYIQISHGFYFRVRVDTSSYIGSFWLSAFLDPYLLGLEQKSSKCVFQNPALHSSS